MDTLPAAREIPFFNYRKAFLDDEEAYAAIFRDVLRRGAFIDQRDLQEFEQRVAEYVGVKGAIGVGSGTDGLVMSWRTVALKAGDEVIFPSHTLVASPASVYFAGGVPVPVDIGDDGLLDPDAVEEAMTPRTVGIMPVHLNGRTCDMGRIMEIAERRGLVVIEDAAQALGSKYKGRAAGTFGRAGAFSFYPAKILGCMGDGGMVVTDDDATAAQIRLLRDHGRGDDGEVHCWGLNSRLDNMQAAFLNHQFKNYARIVSRRREIAASYHRLLGDVEQLTLPAAPDSDPDRFDVFQNFELLAERRDDLRAHLQKHGVGTLVQWGGKAVHQWPELGIDLHLPNTEKFFERCVMFPMNTTLDDGDVEYVSELVRGFYGR